MKQVVSLFILPIILAASSIGALGQSIPATPDPADCTVTAPADSDLYQIAAGDFAPPGSHEKTADQPDPDDVEDATATVLMSIACTNANRQLAALALFTDRYITERFSTPEGSDELGHLIAASSRDVAPASSQDRLAVEFVGDAVQYEDGRIGLTVQTSNAEAIFRDSVILAEIDGEWLIDEVLAGDETNRAGTPEAGSHRDQKPVG